METGLMKPLFNDLRYEKNVPKVITIQQFIVSSNVFETQCAIIDNHNLYSTAQFVQSKKLLTKSYRHRKYLSLTARLCIKRQHPQTNKRNGAMPQNMKH